MGSFSQTFGVKPILIYLRRNHEAFHPFYGHPFYGHPGCAPAVCEGCAAEGAADVAAVLAIDCHADLVDCHAGAVAGIKDCHEPLKGCYKCHFNPADEACVKECLVGPLPCARDNKIAAGKCIHDNKVALAKCLDDKAVSLAKARQCVHCAPFCPKAE